MSNTDTKPKLTLEIIENIVKENKKRVIDGAHEAVTEAINIVKQEFICTVSDYVFSSEFDEADKVLAETLEKYDIGDFEEWDILMDFRDIQHEIIDSVEI